MATYDGWELDGLKNASNYYQWLFEEFDEFLGPTILEVGAGMGNFSTLLLNSGAKRLFILEPSDNLLSRLRSRVSSPPAVMIHGTFEESWRSLSREKIDTIVCVNVLEHMDDDLGVLKTMNSMLSPGGALCLFVPALPWLYGTLDHVFGHRRRYMKSGLALRLKAANFEIVTMKYFNSVGILTWFLMGKVLRLTQWKAGSVKLFDRWVVPMLKRFERTVGSPPMGQSLICIAKKS